MALEIRRVITGHDAAGKSVVLVDEIAKTQRLYPGSGSDTAMVWGTQPGFPVRNDDFEGAAAREFPIAFDDRSLFWVISFEPGAPGSMHRTQSVDYIVVLSGSIDMELDSGESVHLEAGDVMVQRGTAHNWLNNGSEPCVVAFVMIGATPVENAAPIERS